MFVGKKEGDSVAIGSGIISVKEEPEDKEDNDEGKTSFELKNIFGMISVHVQAGVENINDEILRI